MPASVRRSPYPSSTARPSTVRAPALIWVHTGNADSRVAPRGGIDQMARLGIAKGLLADYAKLQKSVQKAVDATIEKFSQHTHAGLHLEKLANAKGPRIR